MQTSLEMWDFVERLRREQEDTPKDQGDDLTRVLQYVFREWKKAQAKGALPSQRRPRLVSNSPPDPHPAVA